jgi:hypothetical protein
MQVPEPGSVSDSYREMIIRSNQAVDYAQSVVNRAALNLNDPAQLKWANYILTKIANAYYINISVGNSMPSPYTDILNRPGTIQELNAVEINQNQTYWKIEFTNTSLLGKGALTVEDPVTHEYKIQLNVAELETLGGRYSETGLGVGDKTMGYTLAHELGHLDNSNKGLAHYYEQPGNYIDPSIPNGLDTYESTFVEADANSLGREYATYLGIDYFTPAEQSGFTTNYLPTGFDIDALIPVSGSRGVPESFTSADIYGTSGNDVIIGLSGDNKIEAGDGNDYLQGGAGFDALTGGAGADTYAFGLGQGRDIAYGFKYAEGDRLLMLDGGFTISQTDFGVSVSYADGERILVAGVSLADLPPDWIVTA